MFWIGMIIGAIIGYLALWVHVAWACKSFGVSYAEFNSIADTIGEAVTNRESEIQVWHDGRLIDVTYLEEK